MPQRESSVINAMLVEELRELRKENEQLKHKERQRENNKKHLQNQSKKQMAQLEAEVMKLEEMVFELAQDGEITDQIQQVIERVEKRTGLHFTGKKRKSKKSKKTPQAPKDKSALDLEEENSALKKENQKLKNKLGLDSSNSSLPPSSDEIRALGGRKRKKKGSNAYNSRKKSNRKKGAQKGHAYRGLGLKDLVEMVRNDQVELRLENMGKAEGKKMITRFILDLEITPVIREIHINGDTELPKELHNKVTYGNNLRSIAVMLEVDGLLSIERTRDFINHLSGGCFKISTGTVYNFLKNFSEAAESKYNAIIDHLRQSPVVYTDQTKFKVNGKASYVRNHSTKKAVLYLALHSKRMDELKERSPILMYLDKDTTLVHDHEVGLYNFPTQDSECHVHLKRDLKRIEDETGHKWSRKLKKHIWKMIKYRKKLIEQGKSAFTAKEKEDFIKKFDSLLESGWAEYNQALEENVLPQDSLKFERSVLARFDKDIYKAAYLRFLEDFNAEADNNRSERDLRKVVIKRKQIETYRGFSGLELFCRNLSITETMKKEGLPLLDNIQQILSKRAPSLTTK